MAVNAWRWQQCIDTMIPRHVFPLNIAWGPNSYLPTSRQWNSGARWAVCGGDQLKWSRGKYRGYSVAEPHSASGERHVLARRWTGTRWKDANPAVSSAVMAITMRSVGGKNMNTMKYPGAKKLRGRIQSIVDRGFRGAGWSGDVTRKAWNAGGGRYLNPPGVSGDFLV